MTDTADALVIGGGLHGLSAALQLARRGASVILLERARIGRHASGASAAGVRTLFRAREELPAALVAMEMWHHIEDLVGDDCAFHAGGQLQLAETEAELETQRRRVASLRRDGFMHEEMIDAEEVRRLVPAVSPICIGGSIARRDGAADPHRTLAAFLRSALAAGVSVHEEVGVSQIDRKAGVWSVDGNGRRFEAPMLVNAAGAWGGQIAAMAGDNIPLGFKTSMMIVTERIAPFIRPTVSSVGRKLSFKQSSQGTLLIGGGQQGRGNLETESAKVDAYTLAKSAAAALALFPMIGRLRIVRSWAGLEGRTSDDLAIAGLSPSAPGLMHLFGFSGHGFQLVPVMGVAAADLLLEGRTELDLSGLAPQRLTRVPAAPAPVSSNADDDCE